ncbi:MULTISPECIES: hypothetical protein [unclassified Thalassospira]|uniref:hypothetical protein n=1 Tax=unclassified Thalassospira TaxID=2648997 RepID=UPI000EEF8118|nr:MULTISPECIES: hypothetical protein [unclassified Thalassospira]HAI27965.1 hypothetical protein [Thalassospira sp.]|tara:strand:+ start:813 stop:1100 length:288 start_codon:yes stop_codon:yes gene_type:complete
MQGHFEPKYEDDTHAVEYLPGRWYVCNALDKYSCLEIAQSIADEEGQGTEVPSSFADQAQDDLQIDISKAYPVIDWEKIAMVGAAVLFVAALERG